MSEWLSRLRSRDLGQEAQLVARWSTSRNVYVVGVASYAMPGGAIDAVIPGGNAKNRGRRSSEVACFLLSDAASAMTGALVIADCGATAY